MADLRLHFLGQFHVTRDEQPITAFESDKVRGLLAYLAVEWERPHSRSALTALLWPDYDETSARGSLRQALYQLRQVIGDSDDTVPLLVVTRQTLQWNPVAAASLDVATFLSLVQRCAKHAHSQLEQCSTCLEHLRKAIECYQGEFLAGFAINDSAPFEEWRRIKQEQLHLQALDTLTILANVDEVTGELGRALQYARRQLILDPWCEDAHRQMMRVLTLTGDRSRALAQYYTCRQVLLNELGVEPSVETTALYEAIRTGEFDKETRLRRELSRTGQGDQAFGEPVAFQTRAVTRWQDDKMKESVHPVILSSGHPVTPAPLCDWAEMPAVDFFVERSAEVAQLTAWLTPAAADSVPAQLISILGMGGMGKTTLAAAVTKAVAPNFVVVIWRSLLNAPPLNELLRNWLQVLSRQSLTALPESLDEQLRLLLTYLQQERCLLVLDNVESIFVTDTPTLEGNAQPQSRAGVTHPGYEGYDQLFQRLSSSEHQSCLLLTSREQPYALLRLGRQAQSTTGRIRLLPLKGLDQQAGRLLLESNGLHATTPEAAQLIENCSGNPLALQIVAATIVDFFGGDVAAFQQEEGTLFDGIRLVLDQQFARLSPLEREILIWLAIEREPVTVPTLRSNFVQPVATAPLFEALQALQNRSLLEKRETGFTLQNVIIEYTTEYLLEQLYREIVDSGPEGYYPLSTINISFLNRFALLKAQAKEYVRQSQARLLVQPLAERLVSRLGKAQLMASIPHLLNAVRAAGAPAGYIGGNLLNLLVHLDANLTSYDFSHLCVWQADLRRVTLSGLDFTGADLAHSAFQLDIDLMAAKVMADGEIVIGGNTDGYLGLWRLRRGQLAQASRSPSNGVHPLVFSPSGKLVAGAGRDFVIRLWNSSDGKQLHELCGHQSRVYSLSVSHDDRLFASGTDQQSVYLWRLADNRLHFVLDGHRNGTGALAFRPDGLVLASGGTDQMVRLWDTHTGQLLATLTGHRRELHGLAFSPNGRLLASSGEDRTIHLWDVNPYQPGVNGASAADVRPIRTLQGHKHMVRVLAFHPNGTLLASGSADRSVRLWDVASGQLLHTALGHEHEIQGLSFNQDGTILVSSSADQKAYLWETATGKALDSLYVYQYSVNCVRFSPDGKIFASAGTDSFVRLWDVASGKLVALLSGHTKRVEGLAFSPDGQSLASASLDQTVRVWDLGSGATRQVLTDHTDGVKAVAFTPDSRLLASGGTAESILLWAMPDGKRQHTIQRQAQLVGHEGSITALAFHPDGRTLLSSSMDHTAIVWSLPQGKMIGRLQGHTAGLSALAINPTNYLVATCSFDHTVRLWEGTNQQPQTASSDRHWSERTIAFHPDGTLFAHDGANFSILVFRGDGNELLHTLQGHKNAIHSIDFCATAPLLVSGSWDGEIRLWDLTSGECLRVLPPPPPYTGMKISGVTGISEAQKAALRALGAVEG